MHNMVFSDVKVATHSMHPTLFMLYGIIQQYILFYVVCTTHTVLFVPYLVANLTHSALIARALFACYLTRINPQTRVLQKLPGGNGSFLHMLYNLFWAIDRYIER